MFDAGLILLTLVVTLALRAEALNRLRPLTGPLLITAAASFFHLVTDTFDVDPALQGAADVVLILALGFLVARGCLMLVFDWVLIRRMGITPPRLMREVVALVVYLILAFVLLHSLGIEVTGIIATSAVITVVVGLALQQTLGNLLAGLALAWEQRLSIGTWVEIDGQVGMVEQTGWRSTIFRTRTDQRLLIPNADVGAAKITLLGSGERPAAVRIRLGVSYRVAPDAAKEVLQSVARGIPSVLDSPAPRILTVEWADSAVVYECRLWTRRPWAPENLTDAFLTQAHQALARAGMEIPFPQRTLHRAPRPEPVDTPRRRLDAFRSTELFKEVPTEALESMAKDSRLLRFAPGEPMISSGEESTAMYVILAGEGIVELGTKEVARVAAGDVFGEIAFITGSVRSATVRAGTRAVEAVEIDEAGLRNLLDAHPGVADELAEKMAARQRYDEQILDETGAMVSPAGVVSQLKHHLLRFVGR